MNWVTVTFHGGETRKYYPDEFKELFCDKEDSTKFRGDIQALVDDGIIQCEWA